MSIRQLFSQIPPKDLIIKVLNCIGFEGLDDDKELTVEDLRNNSAKFKIYELIPELNNYYIQCKANIFLNNITEKRCITICRQLLKCVKYTFITREKYIKTKKYTTYRLISMEEKKHKEILNGNGTLILTFD